MQQTITLPELQEGEHYAGLILDDNGAPSHHLILLPHEPEQRLHWNDAIEWAKTTGGDLPTRREQSLLFTNCKQHFDANWYWSGEQHANDSGGAWSQNFSYGYQGYDRKVNELRARAVRRLPI